MTKTYLVTGNCGVGKTYVMRKLLGQLTPNYARKLGSIYFHENQRVAILGKYTGDVFDGSDKLSMSVATDFHKLYRYADLNNLTIVCEGDRFMNSTFCGQFYPIVLRIEGDGKQGREQRGSTQTERQLKSIATRVGNISADHLFSDSQKCYEYLVERLELCRD